MPRTQPQQIIVCAACKYGDVIIAGARHYDGVMNGQLRAFSDDDEIRMMNRGEVIQGFIDQWGEFFDRNEALVIATAAGQINTRRPKCDPINELFSEDLY